MVIPPLPLWSPAMQKPSESNRNNPPRGTLELVLGHDLVELHRREAKGRPNREVGWYFYLAPVWVDRYPHSIPAGKYLMIYQPPPKDSSGKKVEGYIQFLPAGRQEVNRPHRASASTISVKRPSQVVNEYRRVRVPYSHEFEDFLSNHLLPAGLRPKLRPKTGPWTVMVVLLPLGFALTPNRSPQP